MPANAEEPSVVANSEEGISKSLVRVQPVQASRTTVGMDTYSEARILSGIKVN